MCEFEFDDGTTDQHIAKIFVENIYSQIDSEDMKFLSLKDIRDHQKANRALLIQNGLITSKKGKRILKRTTVK